MMQNAADGGHVKIIIIESDFFAGASQSSSIFCLYQRRDDSRLLGGGKVRSFGGSSISHRSGVIAEALILLDVQRACAR